MMTIRDYIKKLYRFYYIGLYHRSAYELKSNTECSMGYVILEVLTISSTLLVTLCFKICNLFGIYFEQTTIIIVNAIFIVADLFISEIPMRYISRNIIDQEFIDSIEQEMKNYTRRKTLLIWFYGLLLVLFFFICFCLSLAIMAKVLHLK